MHSFDAEPGLPVFVERTTRFELATLTLAIVELCALPVSDGPSGARAGPEKRPEAARAARFIRRLIRRA